MKFVLYLTESEDDGGFTYHFSLTESELLSLASMPYQKSANEASELRLNHAGLNAYRLGNKISFMYDNKGGRGSVYPKVTYAELEKALSDAYSERESMIRL